MDEIDYLRLLEVLDDPRSWDYPPDYDWESAERRFFEFAQAIQTEFGLKTECGLLAQDASFLGDLYLPADCFNRAERAADSFVFRVSHWGKLAGMYDESVLEPERLEQIKVMLERAGYQYIPSDVLQRPYRRWQLHKPRPFNNMQGTTWWDRYFEYS